MNKLTFDEAQEIARELYKLFAIEGAYFYIATGENYVQCKRAVTQEDLLAHVLGEQTIALPSAWKGVSKWIAVDTDSLDLNNLRRARAIMEAEAGGPAFAVFSGRKGHHLYRLLDAPTDVKLVSAVARRVRRALKQAGVDFDKVSPSKQGGDGFTAPLGYHRSVKAPLCFLDENLEEVQDPPNWLRNMRTLTLDANHGNGTPASHDLAHTEDTRNFQLHPFRPCVNRLFHDGLQAPSTRHSATLAIATAIAANKNIPAADKERFLENWVRRAYSPARQQGFIDANTTLEFWLQEARRIYALEARHSYYGVSCRNILFRPAMESACGQMECALARGYGEIDLALLRRLGIFAPKNARKPGIGRAAYTVYEALVDLSKEFDGKLFQYQNMSAFAAPRRAVEEQASVASKTVRAALRALQSIGLIIKVPMDEVPAAFLRPPRAGQIVYQAAYYCVPALTREYIETTVLPRARAYARRERK